MRFPLLVASDRMAPRLTCAFLLAFCIAAEAIPQPPENGRPEALTFSAPRILRGVAVETADAPPIAPGVVFRTEELSAVSSESGVLVKFGDARDSHGPRVFDVFWFADDDQQLGAIQGVYGPPGRLRLTDDGRAALAAPRLGESNSWHVALYETDGRKQWEHALPRSRRLEDLAVHPKGDAIVVVMSEFRIKRDDDSILVFTESGLVDALEDIGMVKMILFPDAGTGVFVVGSHGYLLYDLAEGLRWRRNGQLWPIAPTQSTVSPDEQVLFVVERRASDSTQIRITGLEHSTGRVLASQDLPLSGSVGRLEVNRERLQIHVGENVFETRWTHEPTLQPAGQLLGPAWFEARPLYEERARGRVHLAWEKIGRADTFELQRRGDLTESAEDCDQGQNPVWERIQPVSREQESLVDGDVPKAGRICYRLRSRSADRVSAWIYSPWISMIGAVHWPPVGTGDPSILHDYGTGVSEISSDQVLLHTGLDVLAAESTEVRVVRGGVITNCKDSSPREVRIQIQTGPAATDVEDDYYVHMWDSSCFSKLDTAVPSGSLLGTVDDDTPPQVSPEASHLHYEIATEIDASSIAKTLNPLTILSASGQDPHNKNVSMADTTGDSKTLQIVENPHGALAACRTAQDGCASASDFDPLDVAAGDVDLVVDIGDLMALNQSLRVAPYEIEAWIKQVSGGTAAIGSSANPMSSLKLDAGQIGTWQGGCAVSAALPVDHQVNTIGMNRWPTYLSWVVTNWVKDGTSSELDRYCQFWRTKAKSGSGNEKTGSDADEAATNNEARFPDGRYELYLRARDLRQTVGPTAREFIVDNFLPSLGRFRLSSALHELYRHHWVWSTDSGTQAGGRVSQYVPAQGTSPTALEVRLVFSEPMVNAKIGCLKRVDSPGPCALGPLEMTPADGEVGEAVEWLLSVPRNTRLEPGSYQVEITAADLNGNPLSVLLRGSVEVD